MTRITKRDIQRGIAGAKEMLERNADKIDTFEGILSRKYVRDLKTLIMLGEQCLEPRKRTRRRTAQKSGK